MSEPTRQDGRLLTTGEFLAHHYKHHRPKLAFDPEFTPAQAARWRKQVRAKLRELLAFPKVPKQPAPKLISSQKRDGFTLQRWELYPEPFSVVPMLMLIPDGVNAKNPAPGVMCFPGSDQPKEAMSGEPWVGPWKQPFGDHDLMAIHFVKRGFVALAFDNPATGELADDRVKHWARMSMDLIWIGRNYEGWSTFQKYVALQWFKKLPFVDGNKIAASGFSLGGKPALLLALLDDTIRAAVWNSSMYSYVKRSRVLGFASIATWQYIPNLLVWFDCIDLMAAAAPTPFLVSEGGRREDAAPIRKSYELAGAKGGFKLTYMPNFRDAKSRAGDREKLREGIDATEYARLHNYDGDHYFKEDIVVPWICQSLGVK